MLKCVKLTGDKVTYCFCLTDVDAALGPDNKSGFPYIYVFQTATGSVGGAIGLTSIILVLGLAGATSFFASTSRQTFGREHLTISNFQAGWLHD